MDISETSNRIGNSIQTFTNKLFWPLDPRPEDICIEDIAHALSNKCRFSGHTKDFYSVAQHSVIVSKVCDPKDALWGLLHDASEAYLVDLPKPLKILPEFKWFVGVENAVQAAICKHFGLSIEQPESTHVGDRIALATEKRDLMPAGSPERGWEKKYKEKPMADKIVGWAPHYAEKQFLNRFRELTLKL